MKLVLFRCPKCGLTIEALPSSRPCHHCRKPGSNIPFGPERAFVRVDEDDAA